MTIAEVLAQKGIPTADMEVLLARALRKDRTYLQAHGDMQLAVGDWARVTQWMERRKNHEPTAYIIGQQEFYGRIFKVDPRVLIPRPSTEGLIEMALNFLKDGKEDQREVDSKIIVMAKKFTSTPSPSFTGGGEDARTIVDIGTGSGCIAITLALERPDLSFIATDISPDALDVARENAKLHHVSDRIRFFCGKDLEPITDLDEPFIIVSNPPYIPRQRTLMPEVMREPHVALFGPEIPKRLLVEAQKIPLCRGIVLECESN